MNRVCQFQAIQCGFRRLVAANRGGHRSVASMRVFDSRTSDIVGLDKPPGRKNQPDNLVTMYVCGPTVYDAAHLGHARTYVHFDMIRRLLTNVLGRQVMFVMNITDVNEKIAARAFQENILSRDLADRCTASFLNDMNQLGVELPTFMPRVSTHIDAIIVFIQKLIEGGFAYESNSSVYFDTAAAQHQGLEYGQLLGTVTEADFVSDEAALFLADKKNARDFALWKCVNASRDNGEADDALWDSPWGRGRPGWHIECSAMIHNSAGMLREDGRLDIHGGGIDLKFPHHENERAQSEAFLCCDPHQSHDPLAQQRDVPWAKVFMHTGHLYIKGQKMSKSLKNFVTVQQVLNQDGQHPLKMTPRQMRLMFLQFKYSARMELTEEVAQNARAIDKKFNSFFTTATRIIGTGKEVPWTENDSEMMHRISDTKQRATQYVLDDFDVPSVLRDLQTLMRETHIYIGDEQQCQPGVIREVVQCVSEWLEHFGIGGNRNSGNGVPGYLGTSRVENSLVDTSKLGVSEVLQTTVDFRSRIREIVKSTTDLKECKQSVLEACDQLRDEQLFALGVLLQDSPQGVTSWKIASEDEIATAKLAQNSTKTVQNKSQQPKTKLTDPSQMYRCQMDLYSEFDSSGIPTKLADGSPVSKNLFKKLRARMLKLERKMKN